MEHRILGLKVQRRSEPSSFGSAVALPRTCVYFPRFFLLPSIFRDIKIIFNVLNILGVASGFLFHLIL